MPAAATLIKLVPSRIAASIHNGITSKVPSADWSRALIEIEDVLAFDLLSAVDLTVLDRSVLAGEAATEPED